MFHLAQIKPYFDPVHQTETLFGKIFNALNWFGNARSLCKCNVLMARALNLNDNRCNSLEMRSTIQSKAERLLTKETYRVILKKYVPVDENVWTGRSIRSIKSFKDIREFCKAKYVIRGHRDRLDK